MDPQRATQYCCDTPPMTIDDAYSFGSDSAHMAADDQSGFDSLEDALDAAWDNVGDTGSIDTKEKYNAAARGFDDELCRLGISYRPALLKCGLFN